MPTRFLPRGSPLWRPSTRLRRRISCTSARRWTPASRSSRSRNILIAVAPIIGTPRTLNAALNITEALGVVVAVVEDELEAEQEAQ
jgi:hypothetical protein